MNPIEKLQSEINELKAQLKNFKPLTVDLRIKGKIIPVVILAEADEPEEQPKIYVFKRLQ